MIWIVVPAYNEGKKILQTISELRNCGYQNIVVVDDGSQDDTLEQAKKAGVLVLKHTVNRGQGAALQTGHEFVLKKGAQEVVDFDADGQFDPEDIAKALLKLRDEKLDVVLGSRFLKKNPQIPFSKRYFILPFARLVNRFFTGVKLTDAHNGFRIFKREGLEKITITQDKMAHNTEIIAQINKFDLKFSEIPVTVGYERYGQGWKGGLEILKDLLFNFFVK
ncbi:MAG TPA: glycosyltransferase family 2 protein [Candidatus Magasanikbacteria bacterium]|nr:glycosyltransferase family 2 protein [Candidatus Magasanikbacteria bacterium]